MLETQKPSGLPSGGFLAPEMVIGQFGLAPGMRVADFGSGGGYFTILMSQIVGDGGFVTAIDVVEADLEVVRAKAGSAGIKNLNTVRANLEVMGSSGITDGSQDFVLMANILFQNDEKAGIIQEAKRILKPEGKLVVIDWKKKGQGFGPPDQYRVSKETAQSLAQQEGFVFEREINAGSFHFGLVFRKQ